MIGAIQRHCPLRFFGALPSPVALSGLIESPAGNASHATPGLHTDESD